MISDKLSVGPPQIHGEIDAFNVQFDPINKIESKQNQADKKEFADILNKKDNEIRETSGGTNRKMSERKVDRNPKDLGHDTEKEEKELQPTSNPMVFQQSRVEVVDFDKNPETTTQEVLSSENSELVPIVIQAGDAQNAAAQLELNTAMEIPLQNMASAEMASAEIPMTMQATEVPADPFQANVLHALQQAQNDIKPIAQDTEIAPDPFLNENAFGESQTAVQGQTEQVLKPQAVQDQTGEQMNQFAQQFADPNALEAEVKAHLQAGQVDNYKQVSDALEKQASKLSEGVSESTLAAQPISQSANLGQASFVAGTGFDKPTNAMNAQNSAEIVKRAEFLVKEGGGSAKIRLTPEGMGTVDLKVTLDQGKVQIEMNTSDPQAKKLLQESITDLKSSLASHNFNLDHVKINNAQALADLSNQNFSSQSQLNQHSGQNSSWNQFEGQMQQQFGEKGQQSAKNFSESSVYTEKQNRENHVDNRPSSVAVPKLSRGYGWPVKSNGNAMRTTASGLNMVA